MSTEHTAERKRDPDPEMVPYREDPGNPDTNRPADFPGDVWPPPNPGPAETPAADQSDAQPT
jgi:hypothetical protein